MRFWTTALCCSAPLVIGSLLLDPPDSEDRETKTTETSRREVEPVARATVEMLLNEIERLREENKELRAENAQYLLTSSKTTKELEELRQFLADHREFGNDFMQYKEVKRVTEREARRREAQRIKEEREAIREKRAANRAAAQSRRANGDAEQDRTAVYRRAGFHALGLEVYLGKTSYFYGTTGTNTSIEYEPVIGFFYQPVNGGRINYSSMKLSGSVLNASDEVRNIGVAIAFFDATGAQIGSETVQINNARPNVPYPFSSVLDMASNAPFASSSQWVLYADPVQ